MTIKLISSRKNRKFTIIRWILFLLLILIAFLFTTLGSFMKPLILIPLAFCISMSEDVLTSAVTGALCGLLNDIACNKLEGSGAIFMLAGCVFISLIFSKFLRESFFNITFITILFSGAFFMTDYFLYFVMWKYDHDYIMLQKYIIPEFSVTAACIIVIYPLINSIRTRLALKKTQVPFENNALIKE